jgi:hypothetical protein
MPPRRANNKDALPAWPPVLSFPTVSPRHKGVLILLRGTSEERLFPNWTMGFRDLADDNAAKTPGYNSFMNTRLTDAEFSRDPNRCMKLLLLFKKNM